jgi:hypothetical protein
MPFAGRSNISSTAMHTFRNDRKTQNLIMRIISGPTSMICQCKSRVWEELGKNKPSCRPEDPFLDLLIRTVDISMTANMFIPLDHKQKELGK